MACFHFVPSSATHSYALALQCYFSNRYLVRVFSAVFCRLRTSLTHPHDRASNLQHDLTCYRDLFWRYCTGFSEGVKNRGLLLIASLPLRLKENGRSFKDTSTWCIFYRFVPKSRVFFLASMHSSASTHSIHPSICPSINPSTHPFTHEPSSGFGLEG